MHEPPLLHKIMVQVMDRRDEQLALIGVLERFGIDTADLKESVRRLDRTVGAIEESLTKGNR